MAWIESHTLLLRHRKLVELAKSLRLKPVHCLGHLHVLWHAAMEQAEDGDLSSWSDEFIAESASYQGDAPQFVSLLQLHGWLDGKQIHDWLDYAGRFLRGKYSGKKERLVEIWEKHGLVYGEADKLPTSNRQVTDKLPTLTVPNLTKPNQVQEKDMCADAPSEPRPKGFLKPSVEEISEFVRSNNYEVSADAFHAWYESNGWIVGKNKMRDWKAAVRTWHFKNKDKGERLANGISRIVGSAAPVPGKYSHLSS